MKSLSVKKVFLIILITIIVMLILLKIESPNNKNTIEIISNSVSF